MDEDPVWIPTVKLGLHERTGDFALLRYGQKEGGGAAYVVGPLIRVSSVEMAERGLEIVSQGLEEAGVASPVTLRSKDASAYQSFRKHLIAS